MKRILVDITDLEVWNGSHGGIQRVVYMVTSHLVNYDKITFVAYDKEAGRFYHTDLQPVLDRVNDLDTAPIPAEVSVDTPHRGFLRRVYARTKKYRIVRYLGRQARAITVDSRPNEVSMPIEREWVEYTKNDTLFILGMAWEYEGLERSLTAIRTQFGCKVVQLTYDLIICLYPHLHHPANYEPYMAYMRQVLVNSDELLAISESTKKDIGIFAKEEGIKTPPVKVIRLGDEINTAKITSSKPTIMGLSKEFILCVGTVEVRKNHALLYYAYKLANSRGVKLPQLIIVGGSGWYSGDVQYLIATDPVIKNIIKIVHGLSDTELAWLYEHCAYTVYPSMYEGWGLPIAESLAYGKLCLAANSSSMPEIAGELIEYFSPFDSAHCMELIKKYADSTKRETIEQKIKSGYKTTSWQETADAIYAALDDKRETGNDK